jgi:putative SOS response-associated peptidase YedK
MLANLTLMSFAQMARGPSVLWSGRAYEWGEDREPEKQPPAIALADRRLMALAGLWESWRSPAGKRVRSFAILTTAANELCAEPTIERR